MQRNLGLYIHIPFCKQKCNYCDFYSLGCNENKIPDYIDALCTHISREAHLYKDYQIDTIFLGGGTPSLVSEKDFDKLASTIKSKLNITQSAEFSIEANPGTLTKEKLNCYLKNGVNRLSLGLQSTNDSLLKTLGRIHTYDEFTECYKLARICGFENINVDIMYGLPDQNLNDLVKTLREVCVISPEHISAYCLKIEENTPFFKVRDSLCLPDDETEYDMYIRLCKELKEQGYEQYEISNFSKNSRRCVHNLKYWLSQEYIGFGPSSHSFFNGKRYFYENNIEKYISSLKGESPFDLPTRIFEEDTDLAVCSMDEYVMLKLRLTDGINEKEFFEKFGVTFVSQYPNISEFLKDDFVKKENGAYSFTSKGFFVSNYILSHILKYI